jgi:hypothetical protein
MSNVVRLSAAQYRLVLATQYWNCSRAIFEGLKLQCGANDFHFLISLRSFIEYTRRGIWFLAWASDEKLLRAQKLTFERSGSPDLVRMDELINEALGLGKKSHLRNPVAGINEPFIDCLHALTHGNPISARFMAFGLDKIFQTGNLLTRAEMEMDLFSILLFRRVLGEDAQSIWKTLATIHNRPGDMKANARISAHRLNEAGLDKPFELA